MGGTGYVFINFEQAAGFGHVGWGFQLDENEYCFGSTDHLWNREFPEWHLVELLKYMNVERKMNNDFWVETGAKSQMLSVMSKGHHIRYHAYKCIAVETAQPQQARDFAQSLQHNGWNIMSNNCVHQVYSVLTTYGGTRIPGPDFGLNRIPKVWFEGIEAEAVSLDK
jgi:hypothetical protein